jgi:hypothetical protein
MSDLETVTREQFTAHVDKIIDGVTRRNGKLGSMQSLQIALMRENALSAFEVDGRAAFLGRRFARATAAGQSSPAQGS